MKNLLLSKKFFSNNFAKIQTKKPIDFFYHEFSKDMEFMNTMQKFKIFRVLDQNGNILNKEYDNIDKETALNIYKTMLLNNVIDQRYNMAQRGGQISFYMTANGEEAATAASTAALDAKDTIYPQYREQGSLIYRGFPLQMMAHQLTANCKDLGKGRQMPVHYGSREHNYQTVSSPLCTQLPQASGAGYFYRIQGQDRICITYFGEGAASEGDFHAALNFAATLNCQTLFYCRNNMYAISTPIDDQYNGDGIAARGIGYGISTLRVDGNDVLAVYNAVKTARKFIVENKCPVLIEGMSYRGGDHSTSDYSKLYRNEDEMMKWKEYLQNLGDPFTRYINYLKNKEWLSDKEHNETIEKFKELARECLKVALDEKKPGYGTVFDDVYDYLPEHLKQQKDELVKHLEKYGEHYNLSNYEN